jgi:transposase
VVNAILWIQRTGAPWRDLLADAGVYWRTAASHFYRGTASSTWRKVLAELQRDADQAGEIDWSKHFIDGSSIRAHQHPQELEVAAEKTRHSVEVAEALLARFTSKPKGTVSC